MSKKELTANSAAFIATFIVARDGRITTVFGIVKTVKFKFPFDVGMFAGGATMGFLLSLADHYCP